MGRAVFSIVVGIVVAMATIFVVEWLSHMAFPPPPNLDYTNKASIAAYMEQAPLGALGSVVFGYGLSAFLGGLICAKVLKAQQWWPSVTVGGVILLGIITNVQMIPHPLWFTLIALVLPLPCSYLGYYFLKSRG